jgi:hypothetical protein
MSEDSLAQRPHLSDRVEPLRDAGLVVLVDGELEVVAGVRLVPTRGHTPGHASVFIESEGEELAVLGDVVVHELQLADPDLVYVSDDDPGCRRRRGSTSLSNWPTGGHRRSSVTSTAWDGSAARARGLLGRGLRRRARPPSNREPCIPGSD